MSRTSRSVLGIVLLTLVLIKKPSWRSLENTLFGSESILGRLSLLSLLMSKSSSNVAQYSEKRSALLIPCSSMFLSSFYIPHLCVAVFFLSNSSQNSLLVAEVVSIFLFSLNSSLNPLVYCWRYHEIREIVKSTLKKVFRISDTGS